MGQEGHLDMPTVATHHQGRAAHLHQPAHMARMEEIPWMHHLLEDTVKKSTRQAMRLAWLLRKTLLLSKEAIHATVCHEQNHHHHCPT